GFEYLETYKQTFNIAPKKEYRKQDMEPEPVTTGSPDEQNGEYLKEHRTSLAEKIRSMMQAMFEVDDNSIN
ncbi:MAG: hypothetical protein JW965_08515, partial [Bacteroidales bacterium]|nr:hypothetical protein [Bacteroidales bacterium]